MDLTPFELLDRLAVLIPPPRLHRHMYHGVLAPNSPLRSRIVFFAGKEIDLRLFWDKVLQKKSKEDVFVKQALIYRNELKIWVFGCFKATKFADLNRLNIVNIESVKIDELRQL